MADITLKRGDSINWNCSLIDDQSNPIDITNYTIRTQGKDSERTVTLFSLTNGNGVTITSGANGAYQIQLLDTSSFGLGNFDVDIEFTDSNGIVNSTQTFTLEIVEDVTI